MRAERHLHPLLQVPRLRELTSTQPRKPLLVDLGSAMRGSRPARAPDHKHIDHALGAAAAAGEASEAR